MMLELSGGGLTTITDLLGGVLQVAIDGYVENVRGDRTERRYLVYGKNDSRPVLMQAWQELDEWGRLARAWDAGNAENVVWLDEVAEDEAVARRTAVFDIQLRRETQIGADALLHLGNVAGTLTITTWPFWENRTAHSLLPSMTTFKGTGYAIGGLDSQGTRDGRISELLLSSPGDSIGRAWCGIRRYNQGVQNFTPAKALANVSSPNYGDDTSNLYDLTGYLLYVSRVTFATEDTLAMRQQETLATLLSGSPSGAATHHVGRYQAFLGVRITATNTIVGVQLRHGFSVETQNPEVWLNSSSSGNAPANGSFYWMPVGNISIPNVPYVTGIDLDEFSLAIYAERKSGTGYLEFDVLMLVPADYTAEYTIPENISSVPDALFLRHTERDERYCLSAEDDAGDFINYRTVSGNSGLMMPPDGAVFVYVIGDDALGKRGLTAPTAEITVYDRWESYGGNG